ncbi:hypothetical protein HL658_17305 [Azospirillum sp. RWY-5-1]|uniref:Uncharacterized protein n=1 Tax=Azospirillum oleiclasticum TaxID=2735135 RepID=A0ABX2TF29_9PROT|nr:hypothetical protein [Azospirillum oleiclasticum]NYZ14317.1 hypothetical protein [Azospirillum oleiclasticum]NYZ21802.1 hypothetical protein [Azospirillum oleiclasticum]
MHALTLYRLAMKNPGARNTLLVIAAALQRGAAKLRNRPPQERSGGFNRPASPLSPPDLRP